MVTHIAVPDTHGYWKVVRVVDGFPEMTGMSRGWALEWAQARNEKAKQQVKS